MEKYLKYAVFVVFLFGLMTLKTQCDQGFKWENKKYDYYTRIEMVTTLDRIFGEDAPDFFEKATGKEIASATDNEIREYLYHLDKDAFPMESIAEEHEASMEVERMSRLGRVVLFFLVILGFVKLLVHYDLGNRFRVLRFLKKFDIGFKRPNGKD